MKNLYKIENELYIISNTENVSENCWIITRSKLVQVSYLLSDEVAKGFKVILTTNKLLIKDGVQAINDEFLEWFVGHPSCEYVEVKSKVTKDGVWTDLKGYVELPTIHSISYKIIIPKEEPKFRFDNINIEEPTIKEIKNHKQETLEEAKIKHGKFCIENNIENPTFSFNKGAEWQKEQYTIEEQHVEHSIGDLEKEYIKGFNEGSKWQQKSSYSEEEVYKLIDLLKRSITEINNIKFTYKDAGHCVKYLNDCETTIVQFKK